MANDFHYQWKEKEPLHKQFTTGVSLHSHTWRSLESLAFLPGAIQKTYFLPRILRWAEGRYKKKWSKDFDYSQGFWTSPVSPEAAYALESEQIASVGLRPFVSITDHEEIAACHELATLHRKTVPVSLEWTVPYKGAVFHVGVHNLPAPKADLLARELHAYTAQPDASALPEILEHIHTLPDTLIVLNHPLSDQGRIGYEIHEPLLMDFLNHNGRWIHALEINALQPIKMNRRVAAIADTVDIPLVAGGDRHAFEPNGAINLTNTTTFAEFVHEVRSEKKSHILFMSQCRTPLTLRYAKSVDAIMEEYPDLGERRYWHDRVFYKCPDGVTRSFTEMIGDRFYVLDAATAVVGALGFVVNGFGRLMPSFVRANRKITL